MSSSTQRGGVWGWVLPTKHPAKSPSLSALAQGEFVSAPHLILSAFSLLGTLLGPGCCFLILHSQILQRCYLKHPSPFADVAIYSASSQHTYIKGTDQGTRSEVSVTARQQQSLQTSSILRVRIDSEEHLGEKSRQKQFIQQNSSPQKQR